MSTPFRKNWKRLAELQLRSKKRYRGFYREKARFLAALVPPGHRVLEVGCSSGDTLAAVAPAFGVGIDFNEPILRHARSRHPRLHFAVADAGAIPLPQASDYVILDGLLGELTDIQEFLERLRPCMHERTRLIITCYSKLWQPLWLLWEKLGWKIPERRPNWLRTSDIANLLKLADLEIVTTRRRMLMPLRLMGIAALFNRIIVNLPWIERLSLMGVMVARPSCRRVAAPSVTIAIPCRNERGNIQAIFKRTPEIGSSTELLFCDGNSTDGTLEEIHAQMRLHPHRKAAVFSQGSGKGKGDAVRQLFARATGEILMILDADLTTPPEELPKFYHCLAEGKAEFVNGSRMVYPMENEAMQHLNHLANWFFSVLFTWLIGQPIRDTLCGTKALWKKDYERICNGRAYFGGLDPFGDFDLLLGAARLHLKIMDLPVRYCARVYGSTNISRFRHGWLLLRMSTVALRKLKFN